MPAKYIDINILPPTSPNDYKIGVPGTARVEFGGYRLGAPVGVSSASSVSTGSIGVLTIVQQPTSVEVLVPATATFTCVAQTSIGMLSYQWKKNGVNVGTNSSTYTTGATTGPSDSATYTCVVSNGTMTVTSSAATLTVVDLDLYLSFSGINVISGIGLLRDREGDTADSVRVNNSVTLSGKYKLTKINTDKYTVTITIPTIQRTIYSGYNYTGTSQPFNTSSTVLGVYRIGDNWRLCVGLNEAFSDKGGYYLSAASAVMGQTMANENTSYHLQRYLNSTGSALDPNDWDTYALDGTAVLTTT